MKRVGKLSADRDSLEHESSESDIDSELERQCRARGRRRSRGGAHKHRVVWHPDMHASFEAAAEALGGPFCATPKAILEHMGGEGTAANLTLANVKSHLQKYRLKEQRRREEEAEAGGRSSSLLPTLTGHAGGCGGAAAVPPVAAVLRGSPGLSTLSPGMVPMNAIGSGIQQTVVPLPAQPLPSISPYSGGLISAAGLHMAPYNVEPPPLAMEQSGEEPPFADERLGRRAAAWRHKQHVLAAQAAALQAAAGPPSQPQQLALILLQRENLKCLQALHVLHLAQMKLHLDSAQQLKEQAGAADAGWPTVEVTLEQKPAEEAMQEVLAAACIGTADGCSAGGSEDVGSPLGAGDKPVQAMEE